MPRILAGRYLVGAALTGSPMVIVHRGYDNFLFRDVTVTILREEFTADQSKVTLFVALFAARGALVHPGIVGTFEVGTVEVHGTTTHWAIGESVAALNLDRFSLPHLWESGWPDRVLQLALQTARAMKYAHLVGAVHGDLGPATVLLEAGAADDAPRVRITGFGPRAADLAHLGDAKTTAQIWGWLSDHLEYPAPEQRQGHLPTRSSDIFGFGCVLAALLLLGDGTRVNDRARDGGGATSDRRIGTASASLARLHEIANQAMSEMPDDRQRSFAEVIEQLRSVAPTIGTIQGER